MQLITETILNPSTVIEEDDAGNKSLFIEGVFMQAAKKNRNGRIYPMNILEAQVEAYKKDFISKNRAIGELNHPKEPGVNPERASHLITELNKSGTDFIGKAKILDTPMGNIVRGLIEGGVQIGVSSRGLGTLKKNSQGIAEVQKDFRLLTVDIVSSPSAPDAFVQGIMEGVEWAISPDGKIVEENIERIRKQIYKTPRKRLDTTKLTIFEKMLEEL